MSITIIEVLQNAKYNLQPGSMPFQKVIGMEQLSNAIEALESGQSAGDIYDDEPTEQELARQTARGLKKDQAEDILKGTDHGKDH